jgi:hypothetical protein
MMMLRRRLASCALALVVCHAALVFAAPLASCCPSRTSAPAAAAEKECCPAGAHAPGECPLHKRSKSASNVSCRLQCDAPHGAQFLLGAVGLLPAPAASLAAPVASRAFELGGVDPETRSFVPDSPPPRV